METILYIIVFGIVLFVLFLPAIIRYKLSSKDNNKDNSKDNSKKQEHSQPEHESITNKP